MSRKGEKILASPVVYPTLDDDGRTISVLAATSYTPIKQDQVDPCVVTYGSGALYQLSLLTGGGVDYNNDGVADVPEITDTDGGSIPSKPTLLEPGCEGEDCGDSAKDRKGTICVGTECFERRGAGYDHLRKRRWYQMEKTEADQFKAGGL
jgi:type IV pilus assembly protein PilY1